MRKTKKALASLAIAGMVLSMAPMSVFGATTDSNRLAGAGRVETAIQIAAQGWTASDSVIVVPADDANIVDALAAAPLAGQLNAPILVTYKGALDPQVQAEIVKLGAKNVYAVGALSADTVASLKAISGVTVTALQGADRTETAAKVAAQLTGVKGTFVVAYDGKADALSAASFAAANDYSIVIANPDGTIPASETVVAPTYTVGGQVTVAGATALAGADRYATNDAVLDGLTYQYDKVYVANGQSLVDALAGAPLAAQTNSPIVLGDAVDVATGANDNMNASSKVIALGGVGAVADSVLAKVAYQAPATLAVESVSAINAGQVQIVFNNEVDETSAELTTNYILTNKAGAAIAVTSAELQDDDKTVKLNLTTPITDATTITVTVLPNIEQEDDSTDKVALYTKVVSVDDQTKPTVTKITAKTADEILDDVKINFSEPVKAAAVIKIDGKVVGTTIADDEVSLTALDLAANVSHTLEVVNLTDTADNITSLISMSFTATTDDAKPVMSSLSQKHDNEILVTFSEKVTLASVQAAITDVKSESFGSLAIGTIRVATAGATTKDTQFIIPVNATLYADTSSRTLTVAFDKEIIVDEVGNEAVAQSKSVVLTEDSVKPSILSITPKTASDGTTTELIVKLSEGVAQTANPDETKITVIHPNGTDVTTGFFDADQTSNAVSTGDDKVELKLAGAGQKLNGTYTFVVLKDMFTDVSEGANGSVAYSGIVNFTASTGDFEIVPATAVSSDGAKTNVITVNYGEAVKGGIQAGSATDAANYTLAGSALPAGTILTLDALTKSVLTINLPDTSSVTKTDASAILSISGVQNSDGQTIVPVTATVNIIDNTKPVLESAQVVGDSIILTFNENMATPTSTLADVLLNYEIKCGSTKVVAGTGTATATLVPGNAKKVQITFTSTAGTNWDSSKTITIKTLDTATSTDAAANQLKSDVAITASK